MEAAEVKKRRVRKKTCEIDSLEKLKSDTSVPKSMSQPQPQPQSQSQPQPQPQPQPQIQLQPKAPNQELNQSQISFGKFNITVKKTVPMTSEELRAYYDQQFKIEDSEKTAKLLGHQEKDNEIYTPQLEKQIVNKIREKTGIHRILSKFANDTKTTWPKTTDLLCWWCCHSFETIPVPCPIEYDELRKRYKVNGIFCSWSCVAAYSIKEYSSLALVYQMKNDVNPTSTSNEDIVVAPSRYILKNFGGYLSIESFRALDKTRTLLMSTETLSYINQEIYEIRN